MIPDDPHATQRSSCPECGASVPDGLTCREHFHSLLLLESQMPGGPGNVPHFYAVASYALQHPVSMRYTPEALTGLRASVADVLAGRADIAEIRRRGAELSGARGRVTRRGGERPLSWPVTSWPMVVTDVVAGGAEGYVEGVTAWARSIVETLDRAEGADL